MITIKGYLVTLEGEISEEQSERIVNAINMIKGVHNIKPYVKGFEDYMCQHQGRTDAYLEMIKVLRDKLNVCCKKQKD